jgi:hypothetical protein
MRPTLPAISALLLAAFLSTACGQLTIRTWVKVVESESGGSVTIGENPFVFDRIQGGFLANVRVDTSKPAPIRGTMTLEDVRLAASEPEFLGAVCVWGNPEAPSTGTVTIDIAGTAGGSGADLVLNLLATTEFSDSVGLAPTALSQPASFDLGGGGAAGSVDALTLFLEAERKGSADGLFETGAAFEGTTRIGPFDVTFALDLLVSNDGVPPSFSADLLELCGPHFDEQGAELFWSVNAKGSYLLAEGTDDPSQPLVIPLADVGAAPGDRLRLRSVGTFADRRLLKDGTETGLTGVFSRDARITDTAERRRVPGALEAGANVVTARVTRCILIAICPGLATDIPEDFRIDPRVDVRIPAGATHLVVAALPRVLSYENNSGFGFGVTVENLGP